jgi:hypothetical protein
VSRTRDGSSAAVPVTDSGPSSRNKIFGRLSDDVLSSALEKHGSQFKWSPSRLRPIPGEKQFGPCGIWISVFLASLARNVLDQKSGLASPPHNNLFLDKRPERRTAKPSDRSNCNAKMKNWLTPIVYSASPLSATQRGRPAFTLDNGPWKEHHRSD